MIKIGIVKSNEDPTAAGRLQIAELDSNGDVTKNYIFAVPCSPNIGDGHGFISVPGPGSYVMYFEAPPITFTTKRAPVKHVWLGAIALPTLQTEGVAATSSDKNDPDESNNTQKDYLARTFKDSKKLYDSGIPEGQNVYMDNDIPQQDIWKSKKGHKFIMSHKITDKGTHDSGIRMQSSLGKVIHLNDGHPGAGAHDRIVISDGTRSDPSTGSYGPNMFQIISGGTRKDTAELRTGRTQTFLTFRGNQFHEILEGKGDQTRDNKGAGDIKDTAYNGNHITQAEQNIHRTSKKGDINETAEKGDIAYISDEGQITIEAATKINIRCGNSQIVLNPESIEIESPQITVKSGATTFKPLAPGSAEQTVITATSVTSTDSAGLSVDLITHTHVGNLGNPTSSPTPK
jgi:hypothetical protein